jgi:hypothetical protein
MIPLHSIYLVRRQFFHRTTTVDWECKHVAIFSNSCTSRRSSVNHILVVNVHLCDGEITMGNGLLIILTQHVSTNLIMRSFGPISPFCTKNYRANTVHKPRSALDRPSEAQNDVHEL